jgi:hypothetical protein
MVLGMMILRGKEQARPDIRNECTVDHLEKPNGQSLRNLPDNLFSKHVFL